MLYAKKHFLSTNDIIDAIIVFIIFITYIFYWILTVNNFSWNGLRVVRDVQSTKSENV